MNCENCGACCRIIMFNAAIPTEWARARGLEILKNGVVVIPFVCPSFDKETGKCRIYENRPDFCKNFKVGGPNCLLCRRAVLGEQL